MIPTGSGNDFCRNLKLPGTPEESLRQILVCIRRDRQGKELLRIDLGQVSWEGCKKPRIFGISAGVGLDALVCKKALDSRLKRVLNRLHLGKLTYLALTVQSLFTMETANGKVITEHGWLHPSEDDLRSIHEPSGRRAAVSPWHGGIPEGWTFIFKQCIGNRQMADIFSSSIAGCSEAGRNQRI